jgi:hypothetical protein
MEVESRMVIIRGWEGEGLGAIEKCGNGRKTQLELSSSVSIAL